LIKEKSEVPAVPVRGSENLWDYAYIQNWSDELMNGLRNNRILRAAQKQFVA